MKSHLTATVLLAVSIVVSLLPARARPNPVSAEPNIGVKTAADDIAVTVNGVAITESQIEAALKPQLKKLASRVKGKQNIDQYKKMLRPQILDSMITKMLLEEKIKQAQIVATDEEADAKLQEIAASQNKTVQDLKALMKARGMSFEETKERIRKGVAYEKLMKKQFADKINVTEEDAKNWYSQHKKHFEKPEQVRASHILIKPQKADPNAADPNEAKAKAKAEAKIKAENLLKQVKAGADFATLAKENSACPSAQKEGDLNLFSRGRMVKPFEEAAFKLKVGQVSDVVETRFGYHIIKVTDHKQVSPRPFEEAKEYIIQRLTWMKRVNLTREYIEPLKAKANIVYPAGKEPKPPITSRYMAGLTRPEINVVNNTGRPVILTLVGPETKTFEIPLNDTKQVSIEPGKYSYYMTGWGLEPSFGSKTFESDHHYTWTLYTTMLPSSRLKIK